MGQAQNLAMGQEGPRQCQNPGRDAGRDNHYFLSKSGMGRRTRRDDHYFYPIISCFQTSFPFLERPFPVIERPFPVLERPSPVFWFLLGK